MAVDARSEEQLSPEFLAMEKRLKELATAVAEKAVDGKIHAMLLLNAKMLSLMVSKGLVDDCDIEKLLSEYEMAAAAMLQLSPDTGKELSQVALMLRHALSKPTERAS